MAAIVGIFTSLETRIAFLSGSCGTVCNRLSNWTGNGVSDRRHFSWPDGNFSAEQSPAVPLFGKAWRQSVVLFFLWLRLANTREE